MRSDHVRTVVHYDTGTLIRRSHTRNNVRHFRWKKKCGSGHKPSYLRVHYRPSRRKSPARNQGRHFRRNKKFASDYTEFSVEHALSLLRTLAWAVLRPPVCQDRTSVPSAAMRPSHVRVVVRYDTSTLIERATQEAIVSRIRNLVLRSIPFLIFSRIRNLVLSGVPFLVSQM